MRYEVWHAVNPTFGFGRSPNRRFPEEMQKVAVVEAKDLDDAFRLTNHVDGNWGSNPGVEQLFDMARSTSTGDVVVEVPTGDAWRCEMVGWTREKT